MNITIIGTGFVGAVSGAVFASLGNQVIGLDVDQKKIESLKDGEVPFYEPKLEKLLTSQQKAGNLTFTTSYQKAIPNAQLIIVAVGTPSLPSGAIDLKFVKLSCQQLAPHLQDNAIVAIKSTVTPGIFSELKPIISKLTNKTFHLVSLPEFLKEGTAVDDTLHPDRVVIGAEDPQVINRLKKLHKPLSAPTVVVKPESAQMIKYAANAYLATRITFINQIANLCEHAQADIEDVIEGIGHDKRIGHHYWYPGLGYGGSCFPKDVNELACFAKKVGEDDNLMIAVNQLNQNRISKLVSKLGNKIGGWSNKSVAVLGLSFKPHTNDTREAPAGKIIPILLSKGASVFGYDPKAIWHPATEQNIADSKGEFRQVKSIKKAIDKAQIIITLIEWPEINQFQFPKTNNDCVFIDTRNQFNQSKLTKLGYKYIGIGR